MGRFDKKEPKLNEVKAVLQRLQGFPEDEKPIPQPPRQRGPSVGGPLVVGISVVLIGGVLAAAYMFTDLASFPTAPLAEPKKVAVETTAPVKSSIKSEAATTAVQAARALMAKGQVRAAREQLLALAAKGSLDAAWDVARSYDPNWLATLPEPDAGPDIPEATRWYRTWYDAAVKEGTVGKNVSVDRIIGAMQQ
jgi:hypothetical protein